MTESVLMYIAISIIALAIIAVLMVFVKKKEKQRNISPLVGMAFAFVVAGIVFGDDALLGYSLMGIGIVIAVIDIIIKSRKK